MKSFRYLAIALLSTLAVAGCKQDKAPVASVPAAPAPAVPSPAASASPSAGEAEIQAAIKAHLASKSTLNLQAFDTNIQQVDIQGDQATAKVNFQLKNSAGAMQMNYRLAKRNGAWAVISSQPDVSGFEHPPAGAGQNPAGGAPAGGSHSLNETLKNFRDDAGTQPQLPAGHPPVKSNDKTVSQ